jgi:hypothetical protein
MTLYGATQIVVTLSNVTSHYVAKGDTDYEQRESHGRIDEVVKCYKVHFVSMQYLCELLKMVFVITACALKD